MTAWVNKSASHIIQIFLFWITYRSHFLLLEKSLNWTLFLNVQNAFKYIFSYQPCKIYLLFSLLKGKEIESQWSLIIFVYVPISSCRYETPRVSLAPCFLYSASCWKSPIQMFHWDVSDNCPLRCFITRTESFSIFNWNLFCFYSDSRIPEVFLPHMLNNFTVFKPKEHLFWVAMKVKSLSGVQLFVTYDCSLPGSSIHGISQARMLEWGPVPSPGDLPDLGIELRSPTLQADSSPSEPPGNPSSRDDVFFPHFFPWLHNIHNFFHLFFKDLFFNNKLCWQHSVLKIYLCI